jgi:PST family polysaccharide transporter
MALKKVALGAAALSASRIFQLAASFLTVPIMTRLLAPADYGLMAIAMAIVALTLYLSDSGMGRSLVRNSPDDVAAWSSAHWLVMVFTGGLTLLLAAAAYPTAWFFHEPRLTAVVLALSLMPLMHGFLEMPCNHLIQRERLWPIAAAETSSAVLGVVAAIWLAASGAGVWALVGQQLTIMAVKSSFIFIVSGFRPRFIFSMAALAEHLRFARDTLGYAATNFISKQTDPLIIGRVVGAGPLGFYAIAHRIMAMPANIVCVPVQGALYSRLVRLREDRDALKTLVLAVTMAQAALLFPAMTALAVVGEEAFSFLLSDRWAQTGALFSLLAVAGMAQAVTTLNGAVLQALDMTGARLRLTIEFAILWTITALVLVQFGVEAVALGLSAASVIYLPRLLQIFLRPLGCSYLEYAAALSGPVVAALGIVAAHAYFSRTFDLSNRDAVLIAGAELLAAYAGLLIFRRKELLGRLDAVRAIFAAT